MSFYLILDLAVDKHNWLLAEMNIIRLKKFTDNTKVNHHLP